MKLSHQGDSNGTTDSRMASINTPPNSPWKQQLQDHPDKDFVCYILKGIEWGFQVGVDSTANFISATKNMQSAAINPQVVKEYIQNEVESGNIIGPFPKSLAPAVHINRIGVIPKQYQPGRWRLITDLSFPENNSINDAIASQLCSLSYITVNKWPPMRFQWVGAHCWQKLT